MRALKRKASSQKGASITFALLLFLVCAVISSVVIVAATAVGGRASKMAEMDQRYYAVNSAAELLRDILEEPTVTVVTGTRTVTTVDQDLKPVPGPTPSVTSLPVEMNGAALSPTDNSLITVTALTLAGVNSPPSLPTTLSLQATATGNGAPNTAALEATIKPTLSGETLILDISNANNSKVTYTLRLTFKANWSQTDDSKTTYENGKVVAGVYTMDQIIEKLEKTTVKWKMIDLQTVVNPVSTPSSTSSSGV